MNTDLKWTADKPTVPGFYWIRYEEKFTVRDEWSTHIGVVEVVNDGVLLALFPGSDENYERVDGLDAEWYGPLKPPE